MSTSVSSNIDYGMTDRQVVRHGIVFDNRPELNINSHQDLNTLSLKFEGKEKFVIP